MSHKYYDNNYQNYSENPYFHQDDYSFSQQQIQGIKSNGSVTQYNDDSDQQQTLGIMKTQNKRMMEMTHELERKEHQINSLQQQLTAFEGYKMQAENLKRQVTILEEKLSLFNENSSNSDFYSQQLKNISEAENRLRSQIIAKDKIIHDYDRTIKENERMINQLRKQSLEKEGIINGLKQEIIENNSRHRTISGKIDSEKEDAKRTKEEFEKRIYDLNKERQKMEEKVNELIDIVKQQSKELNVRMRSQRNTIFKFKYQIRKGRTLLDRTKLYNNRSRNL